MKVLFLDIDGVICLRTSKYLYFDKDCCDRINFVIEKSRAKVVISKNSGAVAQLGEHLLCKQEVWGSSPHSSI